MNDKSLLKRILAAREIVLVLIILLMSFIIYLVNPNFLTVANFRAVALGFSIEGLVVIAMTMVLISGAFDLSVGSIMAFTGMMTGICLTSGIPVIFSILIGLLIGAILGLVNGFVIAKIKVNALIATLGMMTIARSLTLVVSQGRPVTGFSAIFAKIGQSKLFGIPLPVIYLIVMVIIADYLLRNSRFLRQIYYLGTNEEAARLSGIKVERLKIIIFIISGLIAGFAGIIGTARLNSAIPMSFQGAELRIIAGSVIGGASIQGGIGTILGGILGYIFMALVRNALVLLGVSVYWQGVVQGGLLLLAVSLDVLSKRKLS